MDDIVLYIFLKESLKPDVNKIACCAASAVQQLLMKYFTMQVLASKLKSEPLARDVHILTTTTWLSHNAHKRLRFASDEIFDQIKADFILGKEVFSLKEEKVETTLFLYPNKLSLIPTYIQDLPEIHF